MGTAWAEVVSDYAMVEINDQRLEQDLACCPALFFRKMALYMKNAIPRFNQPASMAARLEYDPPVYGDMVWVRDREGAYALPTGRVGHDLCSVRTRGADRCGNVVYTPVAGAVYHPETGEVDLPEAPAGTEYELDFYTDGHFHQELTGEEKRLLGLCVQLVWEGRFAGDWLNRTPKVKDRSFDLPSEANQTRANTERLKALGRALNGELARFAQNQAYRRGPGT